MYAVSLSGRQLPRVGYCTFDQDSQNSRVIAMPRCIRRNSSFKLTLVEVLDLADAVHDVFWL